MQRTISSFAFTLLALCFFSAPAVASDEVWRTAAANDAAEDGYKLIDTQGLSEMIRSGTEPVIIDVRADYEWEGSRIPGSVNIEFDLGDRMGMDPAKQAAFEDLAGPDKKRTLVIYCRSFR